MHEHNHKCEGCKHDCLHYCDCCNKVFCCKCTLEWGFNWHLYSRTTIATPGNYTVWPGDLIDSPYGGTVTYTHCDALTM